MTEEYELELDSSEICRICLARNSQLKSLFRCDIIDGEIWPIPKVYTNVTDISIEENDNFPHNICTKCESSMFDAFLFKQKSSKSHKLLSKILQPLAAAERNASVGPMLAESHSQSTQTEITNEEESLLEINDDKMDIRIIKPMLSDEFIDENEDDGDEDPNESWQLIYLTNEDAAIEPDLSQCEETDIDSDIQNDPLMESEKPDTELSECSHCCEPISQSQMQAHLKLHGKIFQYLMTSSEFFRCSRCLNIYPDMDGLLRHVNAETVCERSAELDKDDCTDYQYLASDPPIRLFTTFKDDDSPLFSCNLCDLDFEEVQTYFAHFEEDHLPTIETNSEYMRSELMHSCGICDVSFSNLQDTLHHVYFHQSGYPCPYGECDQLSDSFAALYNHFSDGHKENKTECIHCNFVAKNSHELRQHQRVSCEGRQFKCDLCEKTFYKKSTLNMHARTHTNERRYACNVCPKAFLQSNDLTNHIRTHTLERPFKCEICEKSFKTIGQRIGHMSTHTTENNFECDICNKTFKSARILHGHKKIHGERQFQCTACNKKFNRRYHLTLHMKRHETSKNQK